MKPVNPNAQVREQLPVHAPVDSSPCLSLPHPEANMDVEVGRIGPQQGEERLLTGFATRVIEDFPKEIFSWQMVILGGQLLCCSAAIALTVVSGGSIPLLVLAGIGLAIAIADVACLVYHHQHQLPMAHDSIGNAVFYIANCFVNERESMALAKATSLGGRLALTATVMTHSYWSSTLGLQPDLLERINDTAYGIMSFTRFGIDGMSMTGVQISNPLYRLLAQATPKQNTA